MLLLFYREAQAAAGGFQAQQTDSRQRLGGTSKQMGGHASFCVIMKLKSFCLPSTDVLKRK